MDTLPKLYPNAADLLALPAEDLVPVLLKFALAAEKSQNRIFAIDFVNQMATGESNLLPDQPCYPYHQKQNIEQLLGEAWLLIEREALIMPAPGMNGTNGFKVFTSKGRAAADNFDVQKYREAVAFPKALLHPAIAEKAWQSLARGDLGEAVFNAFKEVEIAVRAASGFSANDVGDKLMRKAFDKDVGPLTDKGAPDGERSALQHLFAGAFGVFRNSHGHRNAVTDLRDAQYQVLLASQLLRIVDQRRKSQQPGSSPTGTR